MIVTVDPSRCIGCGMCAAAAPEVFRVEGRVSVVVAQPSSRAEENRVRGAADGPCTFHVPIVFVAYVNAAG